MLRKALAALVVVLSFSTVGYAWKAPHPHPRPHHSHPVHPCRGPHMPLTCTVGSSAIPTYVQRVIATGINGVAPFLTLSLPAPTTAGSTVIAILGHPGTNALTSTPTGFTLLASQTAATARIEIWAYFNVPAGLQTFSFVGVDSGYTVIYAEFTGVASATAAEVSGGTTASSGTTLSPATSGNVSQAGELAIAAWEQHIGGDAGITFTDPPGWTNLYSDPGSVASFHLDSVYQVGPTAGIPVSLSFTSSATTTSAAGLVVALRAATPSVDATPFITDGTIQLKQNQLDMGLMLGGRYVLEGSTFDGYQLEDGSGVLLMDTYLPQLGDPVTLTNPTWSGRVTSVNSEDIFDKRTNYNRASITATNSTAAPGGTAPGDFADVAVGGYYVLEDGSGDYQLEDGTGRYVLEGTAFTYRHLSLRKSQNQDGTTSTYGYLETFEGGYAAGMTFTLTSVNLGVAAVSYTITNVTTSFIGAGTGVTPLYSIEFGDAYQTLQTAGGGVLTRTGSQATQQLGVAMPGGVLGYAPVTADQGTFTALTDITGLYVTVTVVSGRRIQLTAFADAASVAGDVVGLQILEGATLLKEFQLRVGAVADSKTSIGGSVYAQPTAGVHTYKVAMRRVSGTGNVTMYATAPAGPAYIACEDAGT